MANPECLKAARNGRKAWKKWRLENPDEPADFSGTNFTKQENENINFAGFEFGDNADFRGIIFGDRTIDENNIFKELLSPKYKPGSANFSNAKFGNNARFRCAMFGDGSSFFKVKFQSINFSGAVFRGSVNYNFSRFRYNANFNGAIFCGCAEFQNAIFNLYAYFDGAAFNGKTYFNGATFNWAANFSSWDENKKNEDIEQNLEFLKKNIGNDITTTWHNVRGNFPRDIFPEISFADARFNDRCIFEGRNLTGPFDLSDATLRQPPNFKGCQGLDKLNMTGMTVNVGLIPGWTTNNDDIHSIRTLRKVAINSYHHDLERDLFILERKAERGKLWLTEWKRRPWKLFMPTLLVWLYGWSSDFGRSFILPLFWLVATQVGFYDFYAKAAGKEVLAKKPDIDPDILGFTLAQAFPYLPSLKLSSQKMTALFSNGLGFVQAWAVLHGLLSALFVFLALLAVRNFFRVK